MKSMSGQEMLAMLPDYYRNSNAEAVIDTLGSEFDAERELILFLIEQLFAVSASAWGLDYWETDLGLKSTSKPDEQRRARVLSKLQAQGPMTKERMEQIIRTCSGDKQACIKEFVSEYRFEVLFSLAQSVDLGMVFDVIEEAKPAHLSYSVVARLRQGGGRLQIGSAMLVGEEITVYPWSPSELTGRGKIFITAGHNTGVDTTTVYPKGE